MAAAAVVAVRVVLLLALPLLLAAGRLRDELYDSVFYADLEGVTSLLRDLKEGVLRAGHAPIELNRRDSIEHDRTSLMMCGMYDPTEASAKDRTVTVDKDCAKIAALLMKAGADMHHADKHGWTALHHGAVRGFTKFCRFLVSKAKLPLNSQDAEGMTALMRAAGGGWLNTTRALLSLGADFQVRDLKGKTALHLVVQMAVLKASYVPYLRAVMDLFPRDALELGDEHDRTPLHYALIGKGSHECARVLLEAGADSSRADAFKVTPYQMASSEQSRGLIAEYNARAAEEAHRVWREQQEMKEL